MLPLLAAGTAVAAGVAHGSAAAGLVPAEGGELDPNTRGEPLDGGTPTPPIPPHGSGMVEDMMGPIPPHGSAWDCAAEAAGGCPAGDQGSKPTTENI